MALRDDVLDVAFVSPETMGVVDELQLLTGLRINPLIGPLSLRRVPARGALPRRPREQGHRRGRGFREIGTTTRASSTRASSTSTSAAADENGRIVRLVNQILEQAMRNGASDIHLEPFEDGCKFRLRIDGVLHELPSPSKAVFIMILSRLKVLAKMDIAEKRSAPGRCHRPVGPATSGSTCASTRCRPSTARRWSCESSTRTPSR